MKKIIIILLAFLTFSAYGQAEFEKIAITENVATASTSKIVSQQPGTGELNYINATALPLSVDVVNALKLKSYLSTGLLKNGLLQANVNTTLFDITAGTGIISNFDNPDASTSDIIIFPSFTGILSPYLTTSNITYVAINNVPAVVMQASPFTDSQRRDLIILGAIVHSNLTTINTINNISAPSNADTNQLHDLMEAIGALNISGNKYSANGANLSLNKSAGDIFKLGINFANNWKDPHKLTIDAQTLLTLRYRTQNGTEGADVTVLNPAVYDLNNVLTAVPSNRFSIQTVTLFQSGITRVQYGQNTYATMAEAEAAINTRAYIVEPNIALNGIARAYIILKNSTTSLQNASDAKIVEAQKFGGSTSGGVALTNASIIAALGFTPENLANKQNSLATDGTSTKYPTVDAVNANLFDTSKKWVLFGDSFTDTLLTGDFPYYVLQELHLTGTVTHAVGGNQINDQLTVLTNLVTTTPAYFQNFDLVSILVGVNDFAGSTAIGSRSSLITDNNYAGKLKNMIQKILNSNPDIDIFLMTPTEANSVLAPYGTTNAAGWSLKELSVLIGQIAADYGIQCIDLYSLSNFNLQTIPSLTTDLLHPNATGIKYISEAVVSGFKTKNNAGKNIDLGLNKFTTNNFPIFKDKSIDSSLLFQNTNNLGWNTLSSFSPFGLNVNGAGGDKMMTIGDFPNPTNRADFYIRSTSDARIYSGGGSLSLGVADGNQDMFISSTADFGFGTISPTSKVDIVKNDNVNSAISNALSVSHSSNLGTANGIGVSMDFKVENDTYGGLFSIGKIATQLVSGADISGDMIFYTNAFTSVSTERLRLKSDGIVQVPDLSGTGTRTVVADASGNLSATGIGYKVYTALLSQTGTSAPTAIVQENTIGSIVWSRTVAGNYFATLSGAYTTDKTTVFITNGASNATYIHGSAVSTTNVNVVTLDDGQIDRATIEIRVYN